MTQSDVQRVTDIMVEISRASMQQQRCIMQIGRAIVDIDKVTQHNAALVEEAAGVAASLTELAQRLARLATQFRTGAASAGDRRVQHTS